MPSSTLVKEPSPALTQVRSYWSNGLPWAKKGSLAFLDQALISGSNFLLTILLARWLTATQYGAFALAFSFFLLLAGVHESLISEPLMVFGPSSYAGRQREYLGAVLWIEAALDLGLVGVLVSASLIAGCFTPGGELTKALLGLCLSTPCVFLLWVTRYFFYLQQRPDQAATGSTLYSVMLVVGTFLVFQLGILSPFTAFLVIAFGAITTAVFMLVRLKPVVNRAGNPDVKSVWKTHWDYGRWALGAAGMRWIPGNAYYALTGTLLGLSDVGTLKALLNFSLPLGQAANSFGLLFLPHLSGVFGKKGRSATKAPLRWLAWIYLGGGSLYLIVVTVFSVPLMRLLYGGKFLSSAYLIPWVCCGAVLTVVSYVPSTGLRAIRCPSSIFLVYCVVAAISVVSGSIGIWLFGLSGAIGTYVLTGVAVLLLAAGLYRSKLRTSLPGNSCGESAPGKASQLNAELL